MPYFHRFPAFAVTACLCVAPAARADDSTSGSADAAGGWSGSVSLASHYPSRGLDLSDGPPVPQGGAEYAFGGGWYLNGYAAKTRYFGLDVEVDANAGLRGARGSLRYDLGLYYYAYPGGDPRLHASYGELGTRISWVAGPVTPVMELYVTPNYFFGAGKGLFVNAGIDFPLPLQWRGSARYGYVTVENNRAFVYPDYATWLVSATRSIGPWDLVAQFNDTSMHRWQCLDEPRCSLALTVRLTRNF